VDPQPWHQAHWDLGKSLGLFDLERGARLAGSGFPLFIGPGAKLERALIAFMLDLHTREHGYTEVSPPFLVNRETMTGTGQLPKFEDDLYRVSDDLFLIPTAEVPVTNLHRGEVLLGEDLPKRYVAYTPCFRREAGAHGADTRGLTRVHQFDKVELVRIERPEASAAAHEELTRHAETVLQRLELAYRVVLIAAGDMGFANHRQYDLEVWAPGARKWLEVSSCSTYQDFQARRMDLRFRAGRGAKPEFVHTLNGSALALPRTVIALLEAGQEQDGSVRVPQALAPYLGTDRLEARGR
jgi:seryl-tRNA synthetase